MSALEEIKKLLEQHKDDDGVKGWLAELGKPSLETVKAFLSKNSTSPDVKAFTTTLLAPEGVKGWLETAEGKKVLQPLTDQAVTRGIETFKEKTLPGLIQAEYDKKHPPETDQDKQIRELRLKVDEAERQRVRGDLKAKAIAELTRGGISADAAEVLVDYLVADGEEPTLANARRVLGAFNGSVAAAVDAKFKAGGVEPPERPPVTDTKLSRKDLAKMTPEQITKAQTEGKLDHLLGGEST